MLLKLLNRFNLVKNSLPCNYLAECRRDRGSGGRRFPESLQRELRVSAENLSASSQGLSGSFCETPLLSVFLAAVSVFLSTDRNWGSADCGGVVGLTAAETADSTRLSAE